MSLEKRQSILVAPSLRDRVDKLLEIVMHETEAQKVQRKIRGRVKDQIEKTHREYYLQEQAKAIQRELGGEDQSMELEELKKRVKESDMTDQARKKCDQELRRLSAMPSMSAEASVTRTYLETLLSLPWSKRSEVATDFAEARAVLDRDHFGLEKVKDRIMEYLAVQKRVPRGKGPILCFVGPPGVGKTSLGRSIAAATGRVFGRLSLGGVRDEAEIRGHRRTYIGSMPGKIISAMIRAETRNPLILLDEVDKMGRDFRGDPASALLEVLDAEQNAEFNDHYVDVDYDLSEVMFVTTANTMDIPPALADRLEVIQLSGYTEDEKLRIARGYLLPRQLKESGLTEGEAEIQPSAIRQVIRTYTRESGVRDLERMISKLCRKIVLKSEIMVDEKSPTDADESDAESAAVVADAAGRGGRGGCGGCGGRRGREREWEREWERGKARARAVCDCADFVAEVFGGSAASLRHGHGGAESGAGGGPGVDGIRRGFAVHRGVPNAGQGKDYPDGEAGGGDAGVDRGGAVRCAGAGGGARRGFGLYAGQRHAHSPARGGDTQRRSVGGHRGGHGADVGGFRLAGANRHGHDGGDNPARRGFAGWRTAGETAGGGARRAQARDFAAGKQEGHVGDTRQREVAGGDNFCEVDRRGF